jgi:threonine/homoserine/homoserine lactone efflux protein
MNSILINGLILGWSVAWPPGPVNAEMIRRGLLPRERGGGFWPAWRVGLGACTGDFIWALSVAAGAGALLNRPVVRNVLGVLSLALLLTLATIFASSAWKTLRLHRAVTESPSARSDSRGFLLGFFFALSSPWNIGFWLAVVGSQRTSSGTIVSSLALAGAVVLGAIAWTIVLCVAVKQGAHIFSRPGWQVATQALTAAVMIYFAVRLALQLYT